MQDAATQLKKQAAAEAVKSVQSGMVVGLGHGSTAVQALYCIAERLQAGDLKNIVGIPCSKFIESEAVRLSVPVTTLEETPVIDLTIDGADEVDPQLNLIKGGGGALLREKIVAEASRSEIIIVDESKLSAVLGTNWGIPVEVLPFGWKKQVAYLESLGGKVELRCNDDGSARLTDQGNYLLDANFGQIENPANLASKIIDRAGILEHGLFIGLATKVVVASAAGIRVLEI